MVLFRYRAIDGAGQLATGEMEAASEAEVVASLRRAGKVPMRAEPAATASRLGGLLQMEFGRAGLRRQEVADLTGELSIMLGAGQDLDRALRFLVETTASSRVRRVVGEIRDQVRDGGALAAAMARHPASFPRMYVGLVRAGEAGGTLAATLSHLATLLERERALASTITSAMIYPAILMVVALGSITLLLTEVLPQFLPLFAQNGVALPRPTQLMVDAGDVISSYGLYGLAALVALVFALRAALRRPPVRLLADRGLLHLPIVGRLIREVLAARFSRTLGTLMLNGVPLIAALTIVRDALGNLAGVAALDRATLSAQAGAGLAQPLALSGVFPLRMIYLLRLGEETAQLGAMSLRAAEVHEAQARLGVQRVVALLVPVITILMGAAIAGIVSSLLLAMLSLNDLAT